MPWRENKGVCQFKRNLNRFLAKQHLKKDFPQRFLAKQLNIHGRHGLSLKIIFPYKFRINSDDPMIDFWPKAIFHQRFPPKISCACATPKNIRFQKQSTITPGVNWRCPRNRNSPRETYFPFPKSVIL